MSLELLDVVTLTVDLPEYDLKVGDLGTIVEVWEPGRYEVEFNTREGDLVALLTLRDEQIREPSAEELEREPREDLRAHRHGVRTSPGRSNH